MKTPSIPTNPLAPITNRAASRSRTLRAFNFGCSLALLPMVTGTAGAAVNATLTPASTSSVATTPVVLQVTGLANGGTVTVERFVDDNSNGSVDAGEFLAERFTVTDGQVTSIAGVRNTNIPGDDDAAPNGQIHINLIPALGAELGRLAGQQLIRLSSPSAAFTTLTQTLTLTQPVLAQSISGAVTAGSVPLPFASVFLMDATTDGEFVLGVVANASGQFTVNAPVGTYNIAAMKTGYVTDFATAPVVALATGATPSQNLQLAASTTSISGKIADADTNAGLGGVQLFMGTEEGLVALVSSNADGAYSAPVTAGLWSVEVSGISLSQLGYLGIDSESVTIDTTGGAATGANYSLPKVTALIHGTVTDAAATPLAGIQIGAYDTNNLYYSDATTDAAGHYVLGVTTGSWHVNISSESPGLGGYMVPNGQSVTITGAQAVPADFAMLAVNAHLQGMVTNTGSPVAAIRVGAYNQATGQFLTVETVANGTFDLGLVAGTWSVQIESSSAVAFNVVSPSVYRTLSVNQTMTGVNLAVKTATAQITGYVRDAASQPISANVNASATISSVTYFTNTQTDGSGHYVLPVINGTWQVVVSADGYLSPIPQSAPVSDSNVTRDFVLQMMTPLSITTTQLPDGTVGASYSAQLSAAGGQPPYHWYLPDGTISLPPSSSGDMTFSSDGTHGTLSGIPGMAGSFSFLVGVYDSAWSQNRVTQMMSITIHPAAGPPAIAAWRQLYFGNPANSGNGADLATPDHDGIANLVKYGLVIAPGSAGNRFLPAAQTRTYAEGQRLALIFTRDPARNDITLQVQGAASVAGPWTTLATSTNGAVFTGSGFVSESNASGNLKTVEIRDAVKLSAAPSRFMRVVVTH